ncbi:MAG: hypothetical protein B6U89_07745 [Desulfurococcales archaeon ex4484_58]|nr:MAG: hypothetical protein B6U89_07745 [Desulfurococcales archaeon ex4484_58]
MCGYSNESIAEMNIHENLVNLARMAGDVLRVFVDIVNSMPGEVDPSKIYGKIIEPKSRIEENKLLFMEYLARLGDAISYKQNYASIALGLERLTQLLDGASYRLTLLKQKKYSIDDEICDFIKQFTGIIEEQYRNLLEGLKKLRSDPKKTLMNVNEITKLENRADEVYRNATFTLYTKLSEQIIPLMVLKDAIDFIENASDLLKSVGEELRYLALHKVALT